MKAKVKRQKAKVMTGFRLVSIHRRFNKALSRVLCSVAVCLFTFTFAQAQQVVDQILTLVNEDIITKTDLLWSLALDPKAPSPAGNISSDILRQKLDVMIYQRLIVQEARRVPGVQITPEEIGKKRTQLISQFKSEAEFRQRVEAVGLTPQRIDDLIRQMIYIERFIDFRFRSFVFVTEQEIKTYYDERLVPEIRKQGQIPPALDQTIEGKTVRERITEIIKQEKINQEIDKWLEATRQRADIVPLAEP